MICKELVSSCNFNMIIKLNRNYDLFFDSTQLLINLKPVSPVSRISKRVPFIFIIIFTSIQYTGKLYLSSFPKKIFMKIINEK